MEIDNVVPRSHWFAHGNCSIRCRVLPCALLAREIPEASQKTTAELNAKIPLLKTPHICLEGIEKSS